VNQHGQADWQLDAGAGAKGPVFTGEAAVVSRRAPEGSEQFWQLSALNLASGSELWAFPMPTQPSNAPLAGSDGNIYIECYHGLAERKSAPWRSGIWAIDQRGQLIWQHDYRELSRLELLAVRDGELYGSVHEGSFKLDRDGEVILGLPELDGFPAILGPGPDGTVYAQREGELFVLREQ
jgi:outer membrane protein assembly factor BamB